MFSRSSGGCEFGGVYRDRREFVFRLFLFYVECTCTRPLRGLLDPSLPLYCCCSCMSMLEVFPFLSITRVLANIIRLANTRHEYDSPSIWGPGARLLGCAV